jgi:hypothetical protein
MTLIGCLKTFSPIVLAVGIGLVAPMVGRSENILLTVDATQTPRKILHVTVVLPVKPGPVTLYYPKWIPGEHGPDGPVRSITGLQFEANGKSIP